MGAQDGVADGQQEESDVGEQKLEDDFSKRPPLLHGDVELPGLWKRVHLAEDDEPKLGLNSAKADKKVVLKLIQAQSCYGHCALIFCHTGRKVTFLPIFRDFTG